MMKFVWLGVPKGGQIPVNPAQVQYLRVNLDGVTELVFGAVQGGLHVLEVEGSGESVTAALEAALAATTAVERPSPAPRPVRGAKAAT